MDIDGKISANKLLDIFHHALGNSQCSVIGINADAQYGKFIAANPAHNVFLPNGAAQNLPGSFEYSISRQMPVGIIDLLEIVQIHHHQIAVVGADGILCRVKERSMVVKRSNRVLVCQLGYLLKLFQQFVEGSEFGSKGQTKVPGDNLKIAAASDKRGGKAAVHINQMFRLHRVGGSRIISQNVQTAKYLTNLIL